MTYYSPSGRRFRRYPSPLPGTPGHRDQHPRQFQFQHPVHRRRFHPAAGRITTSEASALESRKYVISGSNPHHQRTEAAQPVHDGRRKRSHDEAAQRSTGSSADGSARGQTPAVDGAETDPAGGDRDAATGEATETRRQARRQMREQEELERQEAQRKERELGTQQLMEDWMTCRWSC